MRSSKSEKDILLSIVEKNSDMVMRLSNVVATLNSSIGIMNYCLSITEARLAKLESMQSPIDNSLESDRKSSSKFDSKDIKKNA